MQYETPYWLKSLKVILWLSWALLGLLLIDFPASQTTVIVYFSYGITIYACTEYYDRELEKEFDDAHRS